MDEEHIRKTEKVELKQQMEQCWDLCCLQERTECVIVAHVNENEQKRRKVQMPPEQSHSPDSVLRPSPTHPPTPSHKHRKQAVAASI